MVHQGTPHSFATFLGCTLTVTKISLVLPGTCRTNAVAAAVRVPLHPAYDTGTSGAAIAREGFNSLDDPNFKVGDPALVVEKIYELSNLPEPPLRLVLGEDSLKYVRAQLESITADVHTKNERAAQCNGSESYARLTSTASLDVNASFETRDFNPLRAGMIVSVSSSFSHIKVTRTRTVGLINATVSQQIRGRGSTDWIGG